MTCLYKIVSTARRDDVQVFTKKTHLCTSLTYVDTSMCKFWHMWTCLSGKFPLFAHCERTMRCVHCKTTCVYITFRLTIIITLCFAPTFPSIYLNSHTTMWLFYLQILFNIPLFSMSFESVKPMFSDIVSCVKSWIQRRVRKVKFEWWYVVSTTNVGC